MRAKKFVVVYIQDFVRRIKKVKKRSIYCIAGGFVMAVLGLLLNQNSIYIRPNEIERSSYGTQKTPYKIKMDVENLKKDMEFSVSVSPRKYKKEEADEVFKEKFENLKVEILASNEDYENVNSKLSFKSDLGDGIKATYSFEPSRKRKNTIDYKVKLASESEIATRSNIASKSETDDFLYYVKYKNIIDGSGNVNNEDFKIDETVNGFIEIQLSTEIKEKEGSYRSDKYLLAITVTSKKMTELESFKNSFKKEVEKQDRDTINLDTISLPTIVNNFKIRYKDKLDLSFLLLPVLGILMVILLEAKDKEEENEKRKRRQRLLEMDFAQIISKILLYVSSGMTIRNSLIRLAEQYQVKKSKEEKFEERVAYEELVIVKNKLTSGYSEVRAYEEMAKNINLRTYTRFLNIIIQSIKNGNKELKNILNVEVQDALYERKQNAKKLGEEAATKLVLPLMMMLAVIMVVIMVPAFMGM